MSFALTVAQIRRKEKTVTRRKGWRFLKPGALLQPVVKSQGLKKGERVTTIGGPIRVVSVCRESLSELTRTDPYGSMEVQREGFGGLLTPRMFVDFFCATHNCTPGSTVTRIEFSYEDGQ